MAEDQQETQAGKTAKGISELEKEIEEFNLSLPAAQPKRQKAPIPKKAGVKRKRAAAKKLIVRKSKRKEAVARASMTEGSGTVRINGVSVELIRPNEIKELILEPLRISKTARGLMQGYNVNINVYGGGVMGRAQAARTALAKVLVDASHSDELRKAYMAYDRSMLVDDHRRVEPKKFEGPKARARFQTSYR